MAEPPDAGVQFPVHGGRRSTTATGRETFAVAAEAVDDALARRIRATSDWRKQYLAPARDLVALGGRSPAAGLAVARAGLSHLTESFVYVEGDRELPLAQALGELRGGLGTRSFEGGAGHARGLTIPLRGRTLEGSDLRRQVRHWVHEGVAEPSFGVALEAAVDHPAWFDLSDLQVVLLGAGAELGPLRDLLGWGATVIAVDLPGAARWRRIIGSIDGTPGTLHVPVPIGSSAGSSPDAVAEVAGADLLTRTPQVAGWLDGFPGALVLGNYLYADGALNVRLSMASDALALDLVERRGRDVMLAYLATPTDAFQVGTDAVSVSRAAWKGNRLARATRRPLRLANLFQPNYRDVCTADDGSEYGIADCLVPQQGPNYLLAKRMQRWRAASARDAGIRVSLNVAPSTRTQSVVKNRLLAAAYAGAGRFGMEIFEPETCNALMAALLVRDLRDPSSAANPDVPLHHPSDLFAEAANHGGLWRSPFSLRSVMSVAAVVGMIQRAA